MTTPTPTPTPTPTSPGPLELYRTLHALPPGAASPRRLSTLQILAIGLGLGAIAALLLYPLHGTLESLQASAGRRLTGLILGVPILAIGGLGATLVQRRRERPTLPFPLAAYISLPGWLVWTTPDPTMLFLVRPPNRMRTLSLVCLVDRSTTDTHDAVLDLLDPDHALEADDAAEDGKLGIELAGAAPAFGALVRVAGTGTYALVLGADDEAANDALYHLDRSRVRMPDEAVQMFRPLDAPALTTAHTIAR